jgi:aryl-alcohol dehydrogenase-like predicted oxidoreductase
MSAAMARVPSTDLAPGYRIPSILRGGWQLAGGHGDVDADAAVRDMRAFVDAGLNTFDCADIYTGVEVMYGRFNAAERAAGRPALQVHTKFVPDLADLPHVDEAYVRRIVMRSLERLQTHRLDLVQFHWWDYAVPGCVAVAQLLAKLQREGLIAHLGGTNFDSAHTAAMLDAGVPLVSMQVQYSLLDRRPAAQLVPLCRARGMQLLCYGALAGGFLTAAWLGQPEPDISTLSNRSLVKYKLVIDDFGGWAAFQELLRVLRRIADRHHVGIAAVATRWVLQREGVAAAIVGARYARHLPQTLSVFGFALDAEDDALLAPLLAAHPGPAGDTYGLERDQAGRHGRIMNYNLNKV